MWAGVCGQVPLVLPGLLQSSSFRLPRAISSSAVEDCLERDRDVDITCRLRQDWGTN
jgi:hypothetical protein